MTPVVQEHLVSMEPPILLAAGGTGGHLFPAEALAAELLRRGRKVAFVTDKRGQGFGAGKDAALAAIPVFRLPSGTPTGKKIGGKLVAGFETARGTLAAFALLGRLKPGAVIGFGGYPSLPLMLAATQMRLPTALHEQNAVLGRVNRLLARRVEKIALSYAQTKFLPPGADTLLTGNPVRPAIQAQVGRAYTAPVDSIRLLILGGSQGARILSDVLPEAFRNLSAELKAKLEIQQQCRPEDLDRVRAAYAEAGLRAECESFFADVAERMAAAHLVIGRSGASTVAEIAAIGRPSLLIPYAFATDDHQTANAEALVQAGAAKRIAQADFTAARAGQELQALLGAPEKLGAMAAAAAGLGRADAARALADMVEILAASRRSLPRNNGIVRSMA